jgi:hypothetical protein
VTELTMRRLILLWVPPRLCSARGTVDLDAILGSATGPLQLVMPPERPSCEPVPDTLPRAAPVAVTWLPTTVNGIVIFHETSLV